MRVSSRLLATHANRRLLWKEASCRATAVEMWKHAFASTLVSGIVLLSTLENLVHRRSMLRLLIVHIRIVQPMKIQSDFLTDTAVMLLSPALES